MNMLQPLGPRSQGLLYVEGWVERTRHHTCVKSGGDPGKVIFSLGWIFVQMILCQVPYCFFNHFLSLFKVPRCFFKVPRCWCNLSCQTRWRVARSRCWSSLQGNDQPGELKPRRYASTRTLSQTWLIEFCTWFICISLSSIVLDGHRQNVHGSADVDNRRWRNNVPWLHWEGIESHIIFSNACIHVCIHV